MTSLKDKIAEQMSAQREADLRQLTVRILHTNRMIRMLESMKRDMLHQRDQLVSADHRPADHRPRTTDHLDVTA